MGSFCAQRMIYGKLAGIDREHTVVGQSEQWPAAGGVPRGVGSPTRSDFAGACCLDWYAAGQERLLALSWCEAGPRITRRDFIQAHHLAAQPQAFAPVLPFLPALVAQMRQIPVFAQVDRALAPFVFDPPVCESASRAAEAWCAAHWQSLSLLLAAFLAGRSICIHSRTTVEEKLRIVAALMGLLPAALRTGLTFSTDEFGRKPYGRRLTFACGQRAGPGSADIVWEEAWTNAVCAPVVEAWVAELGQLFARGGSAAVAAAVAAAIARPENGMTPP